MWYFKTTRLLLYNVAILYEYIVLFLIYVRCVKNSVFFALWHKIVVFEYEGLS
jgi:hypothetical protein